MIKIDDDDHVCKEETAKRGEVNPELIKRKISSRRLAQGCLGNKLTRTCKCHADTWTTCTNMKGLLSNLGHEG